MKELHERLKPELIANHTRVLRGPHMTALLKDWLVARRQGPPEPADTGERRAAA